MIPPPREAGGWRLEAGNNQIWFLRHVCAEYGSVRPDLKAPGWEGGAGWLAEGFALSARCFSAGQKGASAKMPEDPPFIIKEEIQCPMARFSRSLSFRVRKPLT